MSDYRKFNFTPGIVYTYSDTNAYLKFIRSEMVMETYILYRFFDCREHRNAEFKESYSILKHLKPAPPAIQVLYGTKAP